MEEELENKIKSMSLSELKKTQLLICDLIGKKEKKEKENYCKWKQEHQEEINNSWILVNVQDEIWPDYDESYIIYNLFSKETIKLGGHPSHFGIDAIEIYDINGQLIDKNQILQFYQRLKEKNIGNKDICNLLRNSFTNQKSNHIPNR